MTQHQISDEIILALLHEVQIRMNWVRLNCPDFMPERLGLPTVDVDGLLTGSGPLTTGPQQPATSHMTEWIEQPSPVISTEVGLDQAGPTAPKPEPEEGLKTKPDAMQLEAELNLEDKVPIKGGWREGMDIGGNMVDMEVMTVVGGVMGVSWVGETSMLNFFGAVGLDGVSIFLGLVGWWVGSM